MSSKGSSFGRVVILAGPRSALLGLLDRGSVCDFRAAGSDTEMATGTSAGASVLVIDIGGGESTRLAREAFGVGTRLPTWGDWDEAWGVVVLPGVGVGEGARR